MKTLTKMCWAFAVTTLLVINQAMAVGPDIDTINVQGYMKLSSGTAVADGTYTLAYGVFQNGTAIWGRSYSTTITNGLFSKSLSGAGGDLSAIDSGTSMNSNWTGATLNPALLMAATSGSVMIRIYAVSTIGGNNPQFDIALSSVPTAFVASVARSVEAGSVTVAGIATASKTNSSSGAGDAGKLVLLDGSGLIATNMIPSLPAGQITSGQVAVANGGTGAATAAGARTNLSAAQSGANSDITSLSGLSTALSVAQGGTGATSASGALTNLGAAASGANSDITSLTGLSTALAVAYGGTGATTASAARSNLSAAASGANSDITSIAGLSTALSVGQGGTGATTAGGALTALGAAASGANSDITSLSGLSTALSAAQGGTGLTSYTAGDIPYASGATTISKLGIGTAGQVLTVNSGATAPAWETPKIGSRKRLYLWEEFLTNPLPTITAASNTLLGQAFLTNVAITGGSTSNPAYSAYHNGVMRVATGTTANQNVTVGFLRSTTGGTLLCNWGFQTADTWEFETSIAPQTSIAATHGSTWIGLFSAAPSALTTMSATLTGAFFEILTATPTTITPYARGSALYTGTADTTSYVLNTYVNYKITYDGTTLTFYINGSSVGSTSTATNINTNTNMCVGVVRRSNTTAAAIDFDYMGLTQTTSNSNGNR